MAQIYITGAQGFIGSTVKRVCEEHGHVVRVPQGDICTVSVEDFEGVDYVLHLAGKTNILHTVKQPEESARVNVLGTIHLLSCATQAHVKKFVFASTASVYGTNPPPWDESQHPDPIEPYSWQKHACESALAMWYVRYKLPTTTLRLFQVFGENYRADSVLAHFSSCKKQGKPLPVTYVEKDGRKEYSKRDFVFVEEVADAFIQAAASQKTGGGEIINIASGKATSIFDVAKMFGGDIEPVPLREFEVLEHKADVTKAKELLDWGANVDLLDWLTERASDI